VVFEDAGVSRLGPLAQTRPVFNLRCGALSLLERQQRCFAAVELGALVRPEMAALTRFLYPSLPVNDPAWLGEDEVVLVNGRWLATAALPAGWPTPSVGLVGGQPAFVALPAGGVGELTLQNPGWHLARWKESLPTEQVGGAMIDHPWDLIEHNATALREDGRFWLTHRASARPGAASVVGRAEDVLADPTAQIEPMVLIDTTKGPVMIDRGALVQAFSRLEGPCYVGPETHVLAGRVKGSSIGPLCRIGGEVEASVVQ